MLYSIKKSINSLFYHKKTKIHTRDSFFLKNTFLFPTLYTYHSYYPKTLSFLLFAVFPPIPLPPFSFLLSPSSKYILLFYLTYHVVPMLFQLNLTWIHHLLLFLHRRTDLVHYLATHSYLNHLWLGFFLKCVDPLFLP